MKDLYVKRFAHHPPERDAPHNVDLLRLAKQYKPVIGAVSSIWHKATDQ